MRIALAKYGYCGDHDRDDPAKTADPSEAIQRLIDINIIPHLGPEAAVDSNEFRKNRLYNEKVDTVLKDHLKMLRSLFKGACGLKRGSKETRMSVSEPVKSAPRASPVPVLICCLWGCFLQVVRTAGEAWTLRRRLYEARGHTLFPMGPDVCG